MVVSPAAHLKWFLPAVESKQVLVPTEERKKEVVVRVESRAKTKTSMMLKLQPWVRLSRTGITRDC